MVMPFHLLHNHWFQFALSLPVVTVGMFYFAPSALKSLARFYPNMDVLILIGFSSAFFYSLAGIYLGRPQEFLFFETAASIVCYTLLGNLLEHRSDVKTNASITELLLLQPKKAKKVHGEGALKTFQECDVQDIKLGDRLYVGTGDTIPCDGKIVTGDLLVDESIITGESLPIEKTAHDTVLSGTVVERGNGEFIVTADSSHSMLAEIIRTVSKAKEAKPSIQRIGDTVSAVFVPVVLCIAIAAFLYSLFGAGNDLTASLLRGIAVLVVACPCAMGLATPTAVTVAIGRAARSGLLIKGGDILERVANLRHMIFDKTGTITTGAFDIERVEFASNTSVEEQQLLPSIIRSLEQFSTHPIATSLVRHYQAAPLLDLASVEEHKGLGISGLSSNHERYSLGSNKMFQHMSSLPAADLIITKNDLFFAALWIKDEIQPAATGVLTALHQDGMILSLLSGDRREKCEQAARLLPFDTVFSEQLPAQKLDVIKRTQEHAVVGYVGDGVNDAPSLSAASVGISFGEATGAAIASASVIILSHDLTKLVELVHLSQRTVRTIKQNLFWAFFYNILMIPLAAFGFLAPSIAALAMALSDIFVIGNSLRLRTIRLK
jgi:Cu+-exporting ATPase